MEDITDTHMDYITANARFRNLRQEYEMQDQWGEGIIENMNEHIGSEYGFAVPHLQTPFNYILPNLDVLHTMDYNTFDNDITQGIHARHRRMNNRLEDALAEGEQHYQRHMGANVPAQHQQDIEEAIQREQDDTDRYDGGWAYWREHGFLEPIDNQMGDEGDLEEYEENGFIERSNEHPSGWVAGAEDNGIHAALFGEHRDYVLGYRTSEAQIENYIAEIQEQNEIMRNSFAGMPMGDVGVSRLLSFTPDLNLPFMESQIEPPTTESESMDLPALEEPDLINPNPTEEKINEFY